MASPRRRPIPAATPGTVTDADEWDDIQTPCSAEPDMWFATDPDGVAYAKAVCASCPMREACLRAVLDLDVKVGVQDGIWGGLDRAERRKLKREATGETLTCPRLGCGRTFTRPQALGHHLTRGHSTHCQQGHRWTRENTKSRPDGGRDCVTCGNLRVAQRRATRRDEAAS